tara:strand:+ start:1318 stop:2445 length:1128 start_codon:yes stop_codon:yes gene_type:complete
MALSKIQTAEMLDTPNLGRRNLIINGGMSIAQRTSSATGIGSSNSGTYNAQDRWNFFAYGSPAARWTQSVSTDVPASSTHTTSLKLDCTTASGTVGAGHRQQIMQVIEAQNLQHLRWGSSVAKKVTLSFWVKSSVTGKNYCWIYHNDGTRFSYKSYTVNSANTWEHKTVTFTGDTAAAITNDNGAGINIIWMLYLGSDYTSATDGVEDTWQSWSAGNYDQFNGQVNNASSTSNEWYLTGVQLELGETASDFEHRSFAEELRDCQRYYFHTYRQGIAIGSTGSDNGAAMDRVGTAVTNHHNWIVQYAVPMRATPNITYYSINGTVDRVSELGSDFSHDSNVSITATYEMGERGINGISVGASDTSIGGHVIANAEL